MSQENNQRGRPARALAGNPLYPAVMVYKRLLCGMGQYTVTPKAWTWTWMALTCVVPGAHKEVSGPLKPMKNVRQRNKHVNSYNYPNIY
jgi:hypothetical protein